MTVSDGINLTLGLLTIIAGIFMFWSLPVPILRDRSNVELPFVSIIIPARNEAVRIKPLLDSLQKQDFQGFEMIVVDDDSSDNTAEVATAYGAEVIRNQSEQPGAGKSLACWRGANHSKGKWLLFLDADTYFTDQDSLEKLLLTYERKGARGILSLQPYHKIYRLYENLSAIFNIIVIVGMNLFTIWGNKFKTAGSFGACIVCDKEDYLLTGGHEKIQSEVMDDLALGEAFLDKNLPVYCQGGKGTIALRMYPEGLGSLIEGWCKSFALGSQSTNPMVMLMVIIWISGSFISSGVFITALFTTNVLFIILSGSLYIMFALQTALFSRRVGNFKWFIFPFYPLLFIFFTLVFVYSLFRVHVLRSVKWKGRKIDL